MHIPSRWQFRNTVRIIRAGGIVAYPTEAVFGLGCDPYNLDAVWKLIQLKRRAIEKGVILIASDLNQLLPFLRPLDSNIEKKIVASWPGPMTWLLPAHPFVSPLLRGRHKSIAVRVTDHPVAANLCRYLGHALVSTSANIAEQRPATNVFEVRLGFGDKIDCLLPGQISGNARPSEIRDALTDKIIRA